MKYEVTYKCGHTGTVELFGKSADREAKLRWYEQHDCPECYMAAVKAEREERAAELGLAELTGSEKQIKWALDLRNKWVEKVDALLNDPCNAGVREARYIKAWKSYCLGQTASKWWIDNRDRNAQVLTACKKIIWSFAAMDKAALDGMSNAELGKAADAAARA